MRCDEQADEVKAEKDDSAGVRESNPFPARLFFVF